MTQVYKLNEIALSTKHGADAARKPLDPLDVPF